jgi:uncharacterized protein
MKNPYCIIVKPIGSICNLRCDYCFYLSKRKIYPDKNNFKMDEKVLETFIRNYIDQDSEEVVFIWQGGEPTLLGVEFFKKVIDLQNKYSGGKNTRNSIQTNGTLINDEWAAFLRENKFLVGLSLDGPEDLHNAYRKFRNGEGSFKKVMKGLNILYDYNVDFNILCCVNNVNVNYPKDIYDFFKEYGKTNYWQFIPIVERCNDNSIKPFSISPDAFGKFLVNIFKRWIKRDIGKISIQLFDCAFNIAMGMVPSVCIFSEICGFAPALEHNGDLYFCDHFVNKDYFIGNILNQPLAELVYSERQRNFGKLKSQLPHKCLNCEVKIFCNGECPKNRFINIENEMAPLNYLCDGYKMFYTYAKPYIIKICNDLSKGIALSNIIKEFK